MLTSAIKGSSTPRLGRRESVALLAALMALNAIGIDAMVPALPAIGDSLGLTSDNQRQLIVICYMLGFGFGQMLWGPLADRLGRKPVIAVGVGLYAVLAAGCAMATSFEVLIGLRVAMGAAAASTRIIVTTIVRDLFEGEEMARVMSLVFMVFIIVPVFAPSLGQAVLFIGSWRAIFGVIAALAAAMLCWGLARLPETLNPRLRRSLDPGVIYQAVRGVVGDRLAVGYTLASTALFAGLSAYIASIQQIVADVFHAAGSLPLVFGAVAAPMALAAWGNSNLVGRFGLRQVGHFGIVGFVIIATTHWALAAAGIENLLLFVVVQGLALMSFALCASNFSTLAMTNMGEIAGTASSVQGVVSTIGGAVIGGAIGQAYNGTTLPLLGGMALCGMVTLGIVLTTERGHLFAPLAE